MYNRRDRAAHLLQPIEACHVAVFGSNSDCVGQPVRASQYCAADDWMTIYGAVCQQARQISSNSLAIPYSSSQWHATEAQRRKQWMEMLGLDPLPKRSELNAVVYRDARPW